MLSAHALPRWLWSAYGVRKGTTTARGLSLSARDRVATCQLPPPTPTSAACLALIRRPGARCLYGVGAALEVAACARCAGLVVVGIWRTKRHFLGKRPLSFSARPWCDVPAAASNANQRRVSRAAQARRRSLSLGVGAALKVSYCARRAALAVVGHRRTKGHRFGETPLYFGTRPWCDVPAAASNANQRRVSLALQAVGEGEAQHSSLLLARALPCWLWSAYGVRKVTASARGLSLSARARGATCQLPPPTPTSAACLARRRRAGSRCLGRKRSTRACFARTP